MTSYLQIANLHIANLNQSFLTSLGPKFLSEIYRGIDNSESCSLIYEVVDGEIVGFVAGGTSLGPIYKAMFPRIMIWGWALVIQLSSIGRIRRIIDILLYSQNQKIISGEGVDLPEAELFSIAVSSSERGKGIAKKLYIQLLEDFKGRGVKQFRIVVGNKLTPAHRFYIKMGAEVTTEIELHSGETSKVYVHNVFSSPSKN